MVTLVDVARHAGVAVSTVSYALSGKRPISEPTRARVERSMEALGYRAGRLRRTRVLGVALPAGLDETWAGGFLAGVMAIGRERGTDVLICLGTRPRHVGAVVAVSPAPSPAGDVPVVRVGPGDGTPHLCRVDVDRVAAGAGCARHLANLGHRTVALVHRTPPDDFHRTVTEVLGRRGGVVHPCAEPSDLARAFESGERPTAVVAADGAALDVALADLDRRGLRVPHDVSVIALGIPRSRPVTAVSAPPATLGRAAAAAVLSGHTRDRLVVPHLESRGTTAPARRPA
ncbi:LacI family DNA-binding transcriptional regulator [Saccharothrix sp. NRRL B-16348]|uniref:LacI family DNA-binding transcriptional regulator n=1 Tax=Saccharothrix sp. NRRL B-16348 TaxID=1415542 RepID=UPI000A72EC20|nr:LacI family DNA-binding transcriptional regulator [Saccharothrix sp. NRRL B-16348]